MDMAAVLIGLYAAFVVFNVLDGYSTWKVLRPDHYARELNPVARWIFRGLGIPLGIIVAEILWIGFISLVFFLLWYEPGLGLPLLLLLSLGIIVFACVSLHNFSIHRRIKYRRGQDLSGSTEGRRNAGKPT